MSRVKRWGRRMEAWTRSTPRLISNAPSFARLPAAHNDSYYRREGIPRLNEQAFRRANPSPDDDPLALLRVAEGTVRGRP